MHPFRVQKALLYLSCFLLVPLSAIAQEFVVQDIGLTSGFQDVALDHHMRGRATVAADFDLDGYVDFYMGNPGDDSYILRNTAGPNGTRTFVTLQVLVSGDLAWGAVAFDYDNDTDFDLFVTCGGNEGVGFDYMFRNEWIQDGSPSGTLSFTDVTFLAGVAGPVPGGASGPVATSSAGAVVADYDRDGDNDLFVNGGTKEVQGYPELVGRNTLWRNNGNGTFTDVTVLAGLGTVLANSRHSTFFDYDRDGDQDLYENNFQGPNILWRNNGNGTFTDVTAEQSAPGHDLSYPLSSYASSAADFNNDGWEDLVVFGRPEGSDGLRTKYDGCGCDICGVVSPTRENSGPYLDGHAIFMYRPGTGFENIAEASGINGNFSELHSVMGCQVGDLNGDGTPDIYIGNGLRNIGHTDQLYLSQPPVGSGDPVFSDYTSSIDFPADVPPGFVNPPYPYRTHGTAFVDIDNDGVLEIAVSNGGPAVYPETVREPDRLFKLNWSSPSNFLKVRLQGNGTTVAPDAIGTRVSVKLINAAGRRWIVRRTLHAGSAFSAQNGFDLHFGLGDATTIGKMTVEWPDGSKSALGPGIAINSTITISLDEAPGLPSGESDEDTQTFQLEQNYPNPFNPATGIEYRLGQEGHVSIRVHNVLGEVVRTLVNEIQPSGNRSVIWNGTNDAGQAVASGYYLIRMQVGGQTAIRKMLLTR